MASRYDWCCGLNKHLLPVPRDLVLTSGACEYVTMWQRGLAVVTREVALDYLGGPDVVPKTLYKWEAGGSEGERDMMTETEVSVNQERGRETKNAGGPEKAPKWVLP